MSEKSVSSQYFTAELKAFHIDQESRLEGKDFEFTWQQRAGRASRWLGEWNLNWKQFQAFSGWDRLHLIYMFWHFSLWGRSTGWVKWVGTFLEIIFWGTFLQILWKTSPVRMMDDTCHGWPRWCIYSAVLHHFQNSQTTLKSFCSGTKNRETN